MGMMEDQQRQIELVFKMTGIDKMGPAVAMLENMKRSMGGVELGAGRMGHAIAKGADRGTGALEKLNSQLERIGNTARAVIGVVAGLGIVHRVIAANQEYETTSTGLASAFFAASMGGKGTRDQQWASSQAMGRAAYERMQTLAEPLIGEGRDYSQNYLAMLTQINRAHVGVTQGQDLAANATAVGMSRNINAGVVGHEMARIMSGQVSHIMPMWQQVVLPELEHMTLTAAEGGRGGRNGRGGAQVARPLNPNEKPSGHGGATSGISEQQFKRMTDAQRASVLQRMFGPQGGFGPALQESANSWQAQEGAFESNINKLFRVGGAGLFASLKDVMKDVNTYLSSSFDFIAGMAAQAGQFASALRPILPMLVASAGVKAVTGKGLLGWGLQAMQAGPSWTSMAQSVHGGVSRAAGAVGGFVNARLAPTALGPKLFHALNGTGYDALQTARGLAGRAGTALSGAASGVWGRVAASNPMAALQGASSAIGGGMQSLRSRAVAALWEARFQAGQTLAPVGAAMGSARSWLGARAGDLRARTLSGLWEARFQAGQALGPLGARLRAGAGSAMGFLSGAGDLARRAIPGALGDSFLGRAARSVGGAVSSVGGRMGVDVGAFASRAAERFRGLAPALSRAGSAAGGFGSKVLGMFTKAAGPVASMMGSFAKLGVYAAVLLIIAAGVREIMKSAQWQTKLMGDMDRILGSFRVLMSEMGADFQSVNDILPGILDGILRAFGWVFEHAIALGRYLGDLAFDIMHPGAPNTRHTFDYYSTQAHVEALNEGARARRERGTANKNAGITAREEAARAASHGVHQDFRGSHFNIHQQYAPGFDPDRIAVSITDRVGEMGRRRVSSNVGPLFSVR